jgi:hypothetical protein
MMDWREIDEAYHKMRWSMRDQRPAGNPFGQVVDQKAWAKHSRRVRRATIKALGITLKEFNAARRKRNKWEAGAPQRAAEEAMRLAAPFHERLNAETDPWMRCILLGQNLTPDGKPWPGSRLGRERAGLV